jgi:NadR type nicotinamide-nucleotide adenylyltransferase
MTPPTAQSPPAPSSPPRRVAILGAESTGKSTLAEALARCYDTVWVPEYLREFVERRARVPLEADQYPIALEQLAREDEAAGLAESRGAGWLFCDTTPLMTALYSELYFGRVDDELGALVAGLDAAGRYRHVIVAAPDLPWVADGLQRESGQVRRVVHARLLALLARTGVVFTLAAGAPAQRLATCVALLGPLSRPG